MREKPVSSVWQALLVMVVVGYVGILLVAPVIAIFNGALEDGIGQMWAAITTPDALMALQLTFGIAILTAIINLVFGVVTAWVLVRHEFPGKRFLNALVDLPFVISPVIVGFVIIVLFGRQGWLKDLPIQIAFAWPGILIVTVFVSLPFVIREIIPVLSSLTMEQEEAAFTLGASRWMVFRRIILPSIWNAAIFGLVLTLARALGEFGAAAVAGGGIQRVTETATIYIFRSIHDRNNVGAYSMAILLGMVSILTLLFMNWLRNRSVEKGSGNVHHS